MDPAFWLAWVCGSWILKTQDCHQYDTARKSCLQSIKSKRWFQHVCWKTPVVQKGSERGSILQCVASWNSHELSKDYYKFDQSFRIIHCDNTQPGSSINWCGFTTSYMLTPNCRTPKGINRSESIVIYCPWKPRAKHISNSFAFQQDAKKKNYTYIIQIRSRP